MNLENLAVLSQLLTWVSLFGLPYLAYRKGHGGYVTGLVIGLVASLFANAFFVLGSGSRYPMLQNLLKSIDPAVPFGAKILPTFFVIGYVLVPAAIFGLIAWGIIALLQRLEAKMQEQG